MSEEDDTKDIKLDAEVAEGILEYLSTYECASERHVCLQLMWHALLRRGAVRALDVEDYDPEEMSLEVRHRPETKSPIKNQELGERFIALDEETCAILDAGIADQRPAVEDEHGRKPLLATPKGRAHVTMIANYVYSVTTPCLVSDACPHDRAFRSVRQRLFGRKPHDVRRRCHCTQFGVVRSRTGWLRTCPTRW